MKLSELMPISIGTYVGLRVLDPSNAQIREHCKANGIYLKNSSKDRRLHTTLIYSKTPCPNLAINPYKIHKASVISYSLFHDVNGESKVLVLRLNAPSITARHIQLMAENNASYDFPTYEPHITIANNYNGDVLALKPITFPIFLGEEYTEKLRE